MSNAVTAEVQTAIDTLIKSVAVDTPLYKACLILARVDKTKVEDSDDKLIVMRALRILHSSQEINAKKSLSKAKF